MAQGILKDVPGWAKGALLIGGGIALYLLFRRFFSEAAARNARLQQNIQQEIRQLQQQQQPSFSESNYAAFANTIHNAIQYCVGDDYGTVEATLKKMRNDLDVAKPFNAYGRRQRFCFGIPVGDKDDLFTAVQAELGQEWGGATNVRVRRINADWKAKGITYVT